jgi:hypothetical protein
MITLIDSKSAKKGYEFIYLGVADECSKCRLLKACTENLEKGRKYRVEEVKEIEHKCPLYGKVKVAQVVEGDVLCAINEKQAFTGAKLDFHPTDCEEIFCENYTYCAPEGLKDGDKCRITDVRDTLECKKGNKITLVSLKRLL